ncbi:hypothetical protein [Planctomycetes bacterium K23_9]|uniref:Uncharacterized protein n=1 Tax=Stieleria marina TaxID=1930275 RepID=A0A517NND1_9BACT|nr:hypothetical protein K239x_05760 [Planctomycetes bacterium K23_9]
MPDPDSTISINPYAPSGESQTVAAFPPKTVGPAVSGGNIVWITIAGTAFSGAVFGLGTALVIFMGNGFNSSKFELDDFLAIVMLGSLTGFFVSGVVALVVVPVCYVIGTLTILNGVPWTGHRVRRFGSIGGFISGFLCVALPGSFALPALAMACVPGTVGAIGTRLVVNSLAKRIDQSLAAENTASSIEAMMPPYEIASNPITGDI